MSLHPQPIGPVPEETARVARAVFPKGSAYLRLRDTLGPVYDDATFAPLFPTRGQPALAPWRLALVTVFQFAEGLSDREAANAVRARLDWKYALGLELTDPGFDFSVLSEFRGRLLVGSLEHQLLDAQLAQCQAAGLLKARGRQRTDSTRVLAAIRTLNRLELVGETLRHALNALAVVAPAWLRALAPADWHDRYATRFENARLPRGQADRDALAATIGADGVRLLTAVWGDSAPAWLREVPAVDLLRQVWLQQYHAPAPADGAVRLRASPDLPPAAVAISSPYDPEARFSRKRQTTWVGSTVHVSETCDDDTPSLLTHVESVPAPTPDVAVTDRVHTGLAAKQLLPSEHTVDGGYVDAGVLVRSQTAYAIDLVGPMRPDVSWQATAAQGFDAAHFAIDWEAQHVTCPAGRTSTKWAPSHDEGGNDIVHVAFDRQDCRGCPSRAQCTQAPTAPRALTLRPQAEQQALQAARARQATPEFQQRYARRAGIEGTLSQGVRAFGLRQARYLGLAKTHLQQLATAAAINLQRLEAWWTDTPRARTRTSAFAAL